ncbi:hypothetical protein Tter_1878 [Thermobaculum terrenum ATCC BAA-798]|uniref:Uncharacterized protein n=1 Tax=Thermobaculum terrenum (strain ATCC BAA-798 / CCMEE 7001 / YNP1) TaxID=525904 RepID=D1CGB3_THET1|nr:hypothetical protein Tter_1878 [Thermobaculum terrenum ATCC BAA-798]
MGDKLMDVAATFGMASMLHGLLDIRLGCDDYGMVLSVAIILIVRYLAGSGLWRKINRAREDLEREDDRK